MNKDTRVLIIILLRGLKFTISLLEKFLKEVEKNENTILKEKKKFKRNTI